MPVLRLAVPTPLRQLFDYLPPDNLSADSLLNLRPGLRVRVPFGNREVVGYLMGIAKQSPVHQSDLKSALEVVDAEPLITPQLLELCRWAAAYYHHPAGEVLNAAFPKRLRAGKQHQRLGQPAWQLTTRGLGLPPGALSRSPRQAQALGLLQDSPLVSTAEMSAADISGSVLQSLRSKGLIERCVIPASGQRSEISAGLALNPEQASAFQSLQAAREGFSCHLLEGVTGSGKTEIYLQLIADCLLRGKQALVLIPEIGLTPQTLARFQQRFGDTVAVLHSGLGEAERYRAWEAAREGSASIVVGTRSAIFTPLPRLALIIVDEEHDSSYKQQDGFRYSARDVAVKRGQLETCQVLLGSATPSLESVHNVLRGKYTRHGLLKRAGNSQLPDIQTIDVRRQMLHAGMSDQLLSAVQKTLEAGGQALLFLNRRGYAPSLRCHDCGWIGECNHCDSRLTVHRRQRRLRCHHCGAGRALPSVCPDCHGGSLLAAGLGTEQTEEALKAQFQNLPVFRVDSDTMQHRGAMQSLVEEINRGQPCILLGTQMLTKGHHFPAVGLVAVIDTDALLFSADFRGEERMAQLLTQVAGRAGRAEVAGKVLLQTHYPDHPAIQAMLHRSYSEQAEDILRQRRTSVMPPIGQLVLLRTDCVDSELGEQFLRNLRAAVEPSLPAGSHLIGPLPSPMQRRAGKYRSQLLLTAPSRSSAREAANKLVSQAQAQPRKRGMNWSIDIDPQDLF